ncbi:iron complex outermembrane recepter protein [Desulfobacula phenolica]|uniref:Iron complex outermembrane recepter protein n=2 Tax=Desulfobacula phenolica TaxID=90732 RepID=A0A1H2JAA4_9BACT|nr:iron complex outermembrane recepter protein [Desulfobacula phenolica]
MVLNRINLKSGKPHMNRTKELPKFFWEKLNFIFLIVFIMNFCFYFNCLSASELDLIHLSLEELMNIKVTSVSKKSQHLSESAAAIFVITGDDLKRSGVTNIPDALRMVPGVTVARIDSNKWAVNVRGFNSRFAAQLLVLIDGRSVYTPTYSGVYWEVNDILLEDVDRIEVIRGPGATLWGANAVNGVINIITKHTKETHGGLVSAGNGNVEKNMASARYGNCFGEDSHWRIYTKHQERDEFKYLTGGKADDNWKITQFGFRMDSTLTPKDNLTVQGDIYEGDINQELNLVDKKNFPYMGVFPVETSVSGKNLLTRWQHTLSSSSDFSLQVYYDTTKRIEDIIDEKRDNFDMDFQHRFAAGTRHDIVWGVRYRYTDDDYANSIISDIDPTSRQDNLYSAFVQDEISFLRDRVRLTIGSKFEHNDYSGYEVQPSARLMWAANSRHKIWGAVSKAVRTPSRAEFDGKLSYVATPVSVAFPPSFVPKVVPLVIDMKGNEHFDAEELMAYELGYRFIPTHKFSVDLTFFYNDYENLRMFENGETVSTGTAIIMESNLVNGYSETSCGGGVAIIFKPSDFFKCNLAYSFINTDNNGIWGFPRHQVSARGQFNLTKTLELDAWLRYVDDTSASYIFTDNFQYDIDDYLTMDLRLGWKITPQLELSLVGQNLLDKTHMEFVQEAFSRATEVERSFYGKLTYQF